MTLRAVKEILAAHRECFVRGYVYGSVARGEEDAESDVDLVLVRRTGAAFFDRIREVMDLVRDLGPLDLLIYTPEELDELVRERGNGFLEDVIAGGVLVEGCQGRRAALAAPSRE
jgi:predicted nucleotidyltransferase